MSFCFDPPLCCVTSRGNLTFVFETAETSGAHGHMVVQLLAARPGPRSAIVRGSCSCTKKACQRPKTFGRRAHTPKSRAFYRVRAQSGTSRRTKRTYDTTTHDLFATECEPRVVDASRSMVQHGDRSEEMVLRVGGFACYHCGRQVNAGEKVVAYHNQYQCDTFMINIYIYIKHR